ncbi:hypothetical protein PORY_000811 [Pneumocystis oryctolagi]|uniref:Uncharacterized protein n=1 Tax=Pneumocystis oryctolagi TaxID=42067 RepID=A0ACB7CE17_9ASCO|nr:hypothetical protein PORY_000811 [Pneumocystis oryctolagi]
MSKIQLNEKDLNPLIDDLMSHIGSIEDVLLQLKSYNLNDLSEIVSKLPVLDKAKFYVTMSYAIYSLIFMNFKLNRVDMKNHAVIKELERVQSYVSKIKEAEAMLSKRTMVLDKQATSRIIAHDLSENTKINENKMLFMKKTDDAKSLLPLKRGVHIRFDVSDTKSSMNTDNESTQINRASIHDTKEDMETNEKHEENTKLSTGFYTKTSEKKHKKHKNKQKKSKGIKD